MLNVRWHLLQATDDFIIAAASFDGDERGDESDDAGDFVGGDASKRDDRCFSEMILCICSWLQKWMREI